VIIRHDVCGWPQASAVCSMYAGWTCRGLYQWPLAGCHCYLFAMCFECLPIVAFVVVGITTRVFGCADTTRNE
jgi:hypothetical protein